MRNYHSSIPTFGKFASLLNEKTNPEILDINSWHFENFTKECLIKSGFISIIRYLYNDTLYLKLYYFEKKIRDNKRQMEEFVAAYYLHEKKNLKYSRCNIIRIPLKEQIEDFTLQSINNISSIEFLLQSQLKEDSWIGIDFTGTTGGLTIIPHQKKVAHERHKKLLMEGYMEQNYEERVMKMIKESSIEKPIVWNTLIRESDDLKISLSENIISLSWRSAPIDTKISNSIKFLWKGIPIELTAIEFYGQRSNTIRAIVRYNNKSYEFGYGRCSLGAGGFGEAPNIISENNKLKFEFGKNWISVTNTIIDPRLELMGKKTSSSFQLLL